ncbi:MAG: penicillin-binding transpeptidase domain-containing protein, partial [Edaphobacter sp.]
EQVGAYSVFPNDGIRIEPRYIRKVTQADGLPLDETPSEVTEVISVETAREMMQLLQAVVQHGTGAAALQLKHPLGGKTGTTNDYTDAWFIGFSPSVTCGTWVGYDDRESLGEKETGARAALPIWMDFMRAAIAKKPNEAFATAGAPQRKLDVPLSAPGAVKPTVKPDEEDPDAPKRAAPASVAPASVAPASVAPSVVPPSSVAAPISNPGLAPVAKKPVMPTAPRATVPAKPAPSAPANGVTEPAKPVGDERTGVSKPPPDTN